MEQGSSNEPQISSLGVTSIVLNYSEQSENDQSSNHNNDQKKVPQQPPSLPHTKTVDLYQYLKEASSDSNLRIAIVVLSFIVITPLLFVSNLNSYQQRSFVMTILYAQWIGYAFFELFHSDTISALRVIYRKLKGFGNAVFPMEILQIYDKPMESISEFAGTRGSTLHMSMFMMSVGTSVLMMSCLLQRYSELNGTNETSIDGNQSKMSPIQTVGIITGVISGNGFAFIGIFELNGYSKINAAFHYIGVGMIACGLVLYCIVTDFDVYYSILPIFGLTIGAVYVWYTQKYGGKGKFVNDRQKIHKISVISVSLELIFILTAAVACVISVYKLDKL